jgi:biotin carboxyl carrier protein
MTFQVEVGGRMRTVSVEALGDCPSAYRVIVDGRARLVDVRRVGDLSLSLLVKTVAVPLSGEAARKPAAAEKRGIAPLSGGPAEKGSGGGKRGTAPLSREVMVAPGTASGELLVTLDGRTVAASVNAGRGARTAHDGGGRAAGEQAVVAPMPGRVVRVLVTPGDQVVARQSVVVVEAMKMENELRSPKAGRVKDVQVTAGASVEAGRILVVVE